MLDQQTQQGGDAIAVQQRKARLRLLEVHQPVRIAIDAGTPANACNDAHGVTCW